jgi:cold shock CspA family protein
VAAHRQGGVRKTAPARKAAVVSPAERRGTPSSGRIVTLFIGQGHGFIRLTNNREIFFHRSDVHEGTSFNDFAVGDSVSFELLEDHVSGPRGLRVERRRRRR